MEFQLNFIVNNHLFLKNPESSTVGKDIISKGIDLISHIGFENFTFKKLAIEINTTEATIYRYFENKHKLLLYILNWYWSFLEYLLTIEIQNITNSKQKLKIALEIFTTPPKQELSKQINFHNLYNIVLTESSKTYLIKEIDEINKSDFFKPYKDLCCLFSLIILEYQPNYKYPKSLSSTIIETAHSHQYFYNHLPKLTDKDELEDKSCTFNFLNNLLFNTLS